VRLVRLPERLNFGNLTSVSPLKMGSGEVGEVYFHFLQ
jgi:hypothetical protein